MICNIIDLQNLVNLSSKTPKLIEIKIDKNGVKQSAILSVDKNKLEIQIKHVLDYLNNGNVIQNSLVHENELFILPSTHNFKDMQGQTFTDWTVKEYLGNSKWLCQCSCKKLKAIDGQSLRVGKSKSCGHGTVEFVDLSGRTFGDWTVHDYDNIEHKWNCTCSCSPDKIHKISGGSLKSGLSKSCGHTTGKFKDLAGQQFGKLKVLYLVRPQTWLCECECTNLTEVDRGNLTSGQVVSCGHCNREARKPWQNEAIHSETKFNSILSSACQSIGCKKLTRNEICDIFNISLSTCTSLIEKYNSIQYVDYTKSSNQVEDELANYIKYLGFYVETHNKTVLDGLELDLYVPEKKLAIEYNGSYWHNIEQKEATYHQNKTLRCIEKGITLIHIFDYEWHNEITQNKLKELLNKMLGVNQEIVYARNTVIKKVEFEDYSLFLNENHLQNSIASEICLGLYYDNILVEIMTFGKARFNENYSTEIYRLCTKAGYNIIGGASKLFAHYIEAYKPESVVSYCDISKFSGNVYKQLGFKLDSITYPGYTYVHSRSLSTLSRMQCMKHKLIAEGWGTENETEEQIMKNRGYLKVYNCGNVRYIYRYEEDSTK